MNELTPQEKPKRSWLRLQFSMLSLLIMTFIVALGVNIYLNYYLPYLNLTEHKFADGFAIRFQISTPDEMSNEPDDESLNGLYVATDKYDRIFCKGRFHDNYPVGRWTIYHPSGRKSLTGKCFDGQRAEKWVAWHVNGHKALEIEHGKPIDNQLDPQEFWHHNMTSDMFDTTMIPVRDGQVRWWWNNGELRAEGQFKNDERQDEWTFYNQNGEVIAEGECDGSRHGWWQVAGERGKSRDVYYVYGQRVDDLEQVLKTLKSMLDSSSTTEVERAFAGLRKFGVHSLPILIEALASDSRQRQLLALEQLATFGADAKPALSKISLLAKHDDILVRATAMHAICSIDESQQSAMFRRLVDLIERSNGSRRGQIVDLVASLDSIVMPHVARLLKSERQTERLIALTMLVTIYKTADGFAEEITTILESASNDREGSQASAMAKDLLQQIRKLERLKQKESAKNNRDMGPIL